MDYFVSISRRTASLSGLVVATVSLLALLASCRQTEPELAQPTSNSMVTIPSPFLLEITGSNKSWTAKYPAAAGGKVVPADRGIHLPSGTEVILVLHSTDYVYTFAIPRQELKELAVPGLEFRMAIRPTQDRQLELVGEGLCGDPHTQVPARLIFDPPQQFWQWQRSQP